MFCNSVFSIILCPVVFLVADYASPSLHPLTNLEVSIFSSDVKRNEFLHKFLLKLDPRQHYFVSSLLAVCT